MTEVKRLSLLVYTASGHLSLSSNIFLFEGLKICALKFECWPKAVFYIFKWKFQLDKNLALNFTLETIKFLGGAANFAGGKKICHTGQLSITQMSALNNSVSSFVFCGEHSAFNHYINWRHFEIKSKVYGLIKFMVETSFQALDKFTAASTTPKCCSEDALTPFMALIIRNIVLVSLYHVETKKVFQIVLHIYANNYQVHDGPGLLSSVLPHSTSGHLYLSSF